jgi:deazaflavin-dependent oxidoreductase (nitroreductase family)
LYPLVKAATNARVAVPGIAILETTGRNSGRPRRTPVGRSLDGDTCWIVAEHGRTAGYVRTIQADPNVRIRLGRRWRAGTAHVIPDDPRARQRAMPAAHTAVLRLMGTDLLTVRIDHDPERRNEQARAPARSDRPCPSAETRANIARARLEASETNRRRRGR